MTQVLSCEVLSRPAIGPPLNRFCSWQPTAGKGALIRGKTNNAGFSVIAFRHVGESSRATALRPLPDRCVRRTLRVRSW